MMVFEEFLDDWNKSHPFANILNEGESDSDANNRKLSIRITQCIDWMVYCHDNNQDVSIEFMDIVFDDMLEKMYTDAVNHNGHLEIGDFIDFLLLIPKDGLLIKGKERTRWQYDILLLNKVSNILNSLSSFESMERFFTSWASVRIDYVSKTEVGMYCAGVEMGRMSAFYSRNRHAFCNIRDYDYPKMRIYKEYFYSLYLSVERMDRIEMAGDIVKLCHFLVGLMRDVLASARNNGYYEEEEGIKKIIEDLKKEVSSTPEVFISYSWADMELVDEIEHRISDYAIVHRDTKDLKSGDSLHEFMNTIRDQNFAVLIVSESYLKSRNCMYEILQLMKNHTEDNDDFWDSVLIFVKSKELFSEQNRRDIIKFWVDAAESTDKIIAGISVSATEELVKEAKIIRSISMEIDKFLSHVIDTLNKSDLDDFIDDAIERFEKWDRYDANPYKDAIRVFLENVMQDENDIE